MPTEWWLRPVISACRVGEHSAVTWNLLSRSPPSDSRSAVGISHGPPYALEAPKPMSSTSTSSTFGAPRGGRTGRIGARGSPGASTVTPTVAVASEVAVRTSSGRTPRSGSWLISDTGTCHHSGTAPRTVHPAARRTRSASSTSGHSDGAGLGPQQGGGVLGREGPREQVALPDVAAVAPQPEPLLLVLYSLAVHVQAERLAEPDHATEQVVGPGAPDVVLADAVQVG